MRKSVFIRLLQFILYLHWLMLTANFIRLLNSLHQAMPVWSVLVFNQPASSIWDLFFYQHQVSFLLKILFFYLLTISQFLDRVCQPSVLQQVVLWATCVLILVFSILSRNQNYLSTAKIPKNKIKSTIDHHRIYRLDMIDNEHAIQVID